MHRERRLARPDYRSGARLASGHGSRDEYDNEQEREQPGASEERKLHSKSRFSSILNDMSRPLSHLHVDFGSSGILRFILKSANMGNRLFSSHETSE